MGWFNHLESVCANQGQRCWGLLQNSTNHTSEFSATWMSECVTSFLPSSQVFSCMQLGLFWTSFPFTGVLTSVCPHLRWHNRVQWHEFEETNQIKQSHGGHSKECWLYLHCSGKSLMGFSMPYDQVCWKGECIHVARTVQKFCSAQVRNDGSLT